MNIQSLVVVVLRLMALDFLYQSVLQSGSCFLSLAERTYVYGKSGGEFSVWMAIPWLILGGLMLAAVLLWACAPAIARLVSRGVPQNVSLGALALADCYSVAFLGVGLMFIAKEVPAAITWAHYLLRMAASSTTDSWRQQVNWYDVVQVALGLTVGIALFVNGRPWSVSLARRDAAGSLPVTSGNRGDGGDAS